MKPSITFLAIAAISAAQISQTAPIPVTGHEDLIDSELLLARSTVTDAADILSSISDAVTIKIDPKHGAVVEYPSSLNAVARQTVPNPADPVFRPESRTQPPFSFHRAPGAPVYGGVGKNAVASQRTHEKWYIEHQRSQKELHRKVKILLSDYRSRSGRIQTIANKLRSGQVRSKTRARSDISKLRKEVQEIEKNIRQMMPEVDLELANTWGVTHLAV